MLRRAQRALATARTAAGHRYTGAARATRGAKRDLGSVGSVRIGDSYKGISESAR